MLTADEKIEIYNAVAKITKESIEAYEAARVAQVIHNQPSSSTLQFMTKTDEVLREFRESLRNIPTKEGMELSITNGVQKAIETCKKDLVSKEEFEPIKAAFGKLTMWSFGLIIVIGTIGVGAIVFLRDFFKAR